jgi:hypothetical protein
VAQRLDSEPLADRAVRAVGSEDVARANSALRPTVARPDRGSDAVGVLLEPDDLR